MPALAPTNLTVYDAVRNTLENPTDRVLARATFGTDDESSIAACCEHFVFLKLGAKIVECAFFAQSTGAVFGVCLDDATRVAVKAHSKTVDLRELRAAYRIQQWLHTKAYPCPRVLIEPETFGNAIVAVQEYADDGEFQNPHLPVVRRAMAEAMAALVERAQVLKQMDGLRAHLPEHGLFPPAHSLLFDFEASSAGAEWIEDIARRAREVLARSPTRGVLGHSDWNAKNMRFADNEITVVYDWESLRTGDEMALLGAASVHFTLGYGSGKERRPTREESLAFIVEYAKARKKTLDDEQRERLSAAASYALAYTARCEHALDPEGLELEGSFREVLEEARNLDYLL